jgi:hypothetical protein
MRAGSVASRVFEHLRSMPEGSTCTSAVLAEACDCDVMIIGASLAPHVRSGRLDVEKIGALNHYSLGANDARPVELDENERQVRIVAAVSTGAPPPGPASIFDVAAAIQPPTLRTGIDRDAVSNALAQARAIVDYLAKLDQIVSAA